MRKTFKTGLGSFSPLQLLPQISCSVELHPPLHTVSIAGNTKCCDCASLRRFCIIINIPSLRSCLEDVEGNLRSNLGREGSCATAKPQPVPAALFEQRKTLLEFCESPSKSPVIRSTGVIFLLQQVPPEEQQHFISSIVKSPVNRCAIWAPVPTAGAICKTGACW